MEIQEINPDLKGKGIQKETGNDVVLSPGAYYFEIGPDNGWIIKRINTLDCPGSEKIPSELLFPEGEIRKFFG
jgi:hypothetical protein